MSKYFKHEKNETYQEALTFIIWAEKKLNDIPQKIAAKKYLDEASISLALNIAEINGDYSIKEKFKFYDIAKEAIVECAGCLDILKVKKYDFNINKGKKILKKIYSMLNDLNISNFENKGHDKIREQKHDFERYED